MNRQGFTLVEVLISVAVFVFIVGGILAVLSMGRTSWHQAELSIGLQQEIRNGMSRVTRELHESGCENDDVDPGCEADEYMISISDNTGTNNTDVLTFSMYLDCNGTKRWTAPLRWACKDSNCLDQDSNCGSIEYSEVEYSVDTNNRLVRKVLDPSSSTVREDPIANNIQDFQVTRSGNIVTVQIITQGTSAFGRQLSYNLSNQAYLRNLFID